MTAGTCTATVTVAGIGTFACEYAAAAHEVHSANLQSGKWVSVSWIGEHATIAPPGVRRGQA